MLRFVHNTYELPIPLQSWLTCKGAAVVFAALLFSACSPTVYKPEVEKFADNVTAASESFNQLVKTNVDRSAVERTTELADANATADAEARIDVPARCQDLTPFIDRELACGTRWSAYRRNPMGPKPDCEEPRPFAPLLPQDLADCTLGVRSGDTFTPLPVANARDAANHLRLAQALAAYAQQLKAIVSAKVHEDLAAAVTDAGAAAKALAQKTDLKGDAANKIGPIADLVGTALMEGLEARRFGALKSVTEAADPAVADASGELSIFANELYLVNVVRPAMADLDDALAKIKPGPAEDFRPQIEAATQRERAYQEAAAVAPGDVFHEVAQAHHEIVDALKDHSRQYEALRQAISALAQKTRELAEVLKRSETEKARGE